MPLGRILWQQQEFFLDSLLPLTVNIESPRLLILHSSPIGLCDLPELKAFICNTLTVESFVNTSTMPYTLPFPPQYFDAIVYHSILDNSLDISRTVFESQRVLKRQHGIFAFDATSRNLGTWIRQLLSEKILRLEPSFYRNWRLYLQPEEIERVLEAYGFHSVNARGFTSTINVMPLLWGNAGLLESIEVKRSRSVNYYCMSAVNK